MYLLYSSDSDLLFLSKELYETLKPISMKDIETFLKCALCLSVSVTFTYPFSIQSGQTIQMEETCLNLKEKICTACSLNENTISMTSLSSMISLLVHSLKTSFNHTDFISYVTSVCDNKPYSSIITIPTNRNTINLRKISSIWSSLFQSQGNQDILQDSLFLHSIFNPYSFTGSSCLVILFSITLFSRLLYHN